MKLAWKILEIVASVAELELPLMPLLVGFSIVCDIVTSARHRKKQVKSFTFGSLSICQADVGTVGPCTSLRHSLRTRIGLSAQPMPRQFEV